MRLNVVPSLDTKDGVTNKNARLFNALRDKDKAVIRPGLSTVETVTAGTGNGMVVLDAENDIVLAVVGSDMILGSFGDETVSVDISTVAGTPITFNPRRVPAGVYQTNMVSAMGLADLYGYDAYDVSTFGSYTGAVYNVPVAGVLSANMPSFPNSTLVALWGLLEQDFFTSVQIAAFTFNSVDAVFDNSAGSYTTWRWDGTAAVTGTGAYSVNFTTP